MATLIVFCLLAAPASAHPQPLVVLAIHGGGFVYGSTDDEQANVRELRARGVRAEAVDYPLPSTPFATYMAVLARVLYFRERGYSVRAEGASAGGSVVAWLAAEGLIDRGVAISPPTDYAHWDTTEGLAFRRAWADTSGYTATDERADSPMRAIRPDATPLLLVTQRDDTVVPYRQVVRFAHRYRRSRLRVLDRGGHGYWGRAQRAAGWRFLTAPVKTGSVNP